MTTETSDFEEFVRLAEPKLRRAFVACCGIDGAPDATAEALAYGWQHWDRLRAMDNTLGYLYRVGRSRTRPRRRLAMPSPVLLELPEVEPALIAALLELPDTQRTAVWLVHACQWRYKEVAEAMQVSVTAVGTHVSRALQRLRVQLEVESRA